MRGRWRISAVAGVAALATAGAVLAEVQRHGGAPEPVAEPPTVTVARLAARAADDVIAAGTINGQRWRLRLTRTQNPWCWAAGSGSAPNADCQITVRYLLKRWPGITGPGDLWTFGRALYGAVRPGVTRVSVRLSDGAALNLRPVEAYGRRWIGLVLPSSLFPVRAVAFSRQAEIAHSVPFIDRIGDDPAPYFLTWLPPGDKGPRRVTKMVSGGGRTLVLHTGPWGNCLVGDSQGWVFSLNDHPNGALEGGFGLPRTITMAFPWPARYMLLMMSDGSIRQVRLVLGAGLGFAIIRAPRRPRILSWGAYGPGGRKVSSGAGAPGGI
jgi:hypothetical protein